MSNMLMAFFPCDVLRTVNRFIFANVFPFDWIFKPAAEPFFPPAKTFHAELRTVPQ